jgi:hypothetical protein
MNPRLAFRRPFVFALILGLAGLIDSGHVAKAVDHSKGPTNEFGAPIRNAQGTINYSRDQLTALAAQASANAPKVETPQTPGPRGFVGPSGAARPFWQYAVFGSGIGVSNIVIGPAAANGEREIIVGGNSSDNFGGDDFWQVLRRNSATGNYDQLFVSPIYTATVSRLGIANVIGDSQLEIAVMLADGRIYLYDLGTKAELGYITTGVTGLTGLALSDLDGDHGQRSLRL